jgi:hypothetical protein
VGAKRCKSQIPNPKKVKKADLTLRKVKKPCISAFFWDPEFYFLKFPPTFAALIKK